jgi:hypothetical protein
MRPLYRIEAPHFIAGFELVEVSDTVASASRVIKYMEGWPFIRVMKYCDRKGWKLERVE